MVKNDGSWFQFAFRFLTNGIWMVLQAIQGRLPKTYLYIMGALAFLAHFLAFVAKEERMLVMDSRLLTWAICYLLLSGLWLLYREWDTENWVDELRMQVSEVKKLDEEMPNEPLEHQAFVLPTEEKKWTNEEAFSHYEAIFPRLVELTKELVPNEHNTLYAMKDFIRWQKDRENETKWRYNEMMDETLYRKNVHTKSWLRKVTPYYDTLRPEFFDETIEMVDRLQKERDANRKGVLGERQVAEYLKGYEAEFLPLYGNRFQSDEGTVENDVLLFTARGIFSLEIKNINGTGKQKLKITRDGQWFEWKKNEWVKSNNAKIFDQVNRHTLLTEKKLSEVFSNLHEVEIKPLIVIPNDNVEIINESQFELVRPSQIPAYIRNQPIRLAQEQAAKMREYINQSDIGQGKFAFIDAHAYAEEIERRIAYLVEQEKVFGKVIRMRELYIKTCRNQTIDSLRFERFLNMRTDKPII